MSLIAIEAALTIADPSSREALVARSAPIQQLTRDKPGCLAYCFAADPCHDDRIQVYELWESEEALAAHFDHPYYHDMRAMLAKGGLVNAVIRKHRIDKTAPVYDANRKAIASFD